MSDFTNTLSRQMFLTCADRLQWIARKALVEIGMTPNEFVLYCIEVDSCWKNVVDELQPGTSWQVVRDKGLSPLAIGAATWQQLKPLTDELPDVFRVRRLRLSEKHVRVIIVNSDGWSAAELLTDGHDLLH